MTSCFEFELLINQKLDHELSEAEEEMLTSHLQTCTDCRSLYEDLRHLQETLSSFTVTPPPYLHSKIMDRIKVESEVTTPESHTPIQKRFLFKWLAVAAALLLLISCTVISLHNNVSSPDVTLSENETSSLAGGAGQKSITSEQEIKPEEKSSNSSISNTEKSDQQKDTPKQSVPKKNPPNENQNSKLQKSIINNNPPTSEFLSESAETDNAPPPTDSEDSIKEQALGSRSLTLLQEDISYEEAEALLSQHLSKEGSSSPELVYQGLSPDTERYLFLYTDDSGQKWNYSVAKIDGTIHCESTS